MRKSRNSEEMERRLEMEKAEREKKRKGWKRSWGMVEEMGGG